MKGRPNRYTAKELAWIEARASAPRRETHAAFVAAFGRGDVAITAFNGLCKRRGWMTGRSGRFAPGQHAPNKGRKGVCPPACAATWFKPGERRGRAAARHKPIGAERVSKCGYLERKVNEDLPFQRRWRAVHLIEWEAANGPLPAGHALKCLDGDRRNTAPQNWVAVPRALLPRLAGARRGRGVVLPYDAAPPELRPALLATAQVEHAVREAKK